VRSRAVAREKAAFGVIRGLSLLTIAILGLIMAFILYKGLRYSNEERGPVLPYREASPDGLAIVVGKGIDLKTLEFPVLYGMYTDEYINWAKISADDFDLLPVAIDPATKDGAAAAKLIFGEAAASAAAQGGPALPWGGLVAFVPSAAAALAKVESTPGAIAVLPASALAGAGARATKTIGLQRLSLQVSEDVAALVDNRSIEDFDKEAVARLASGAIKNWKEMGGPDLEVRLVAPSPDSPLAAAVAAAGYASIAATASATAPAANYESLIAGGPGSAGFVYSADALAAQAPTLTIKRISSGWNLTLAYLLEAPRLSGKVGGISTIIANTFFILLLTILVAAPIGVAAAVYLVEYARQGFLLRLLRLGTETLAGIPSIIFGLFGFLVFVDILHFGFGLLSGCLTLSLMILPTIVRTSEEALKAVPPTLREGSLALGATKLQTIARVAIPAASQGILTGLILGIGRAVGETAALLFTMGSDYKLAKGLFSSARALSAHVYLLFAEGISFDRAFSTATVLVAIVLIFNFAAKRLVGRRGGRT
jgi:phosphate transport system permease protein